MELSKFSFFSLKTEKDVFLSATFIDLFYGLMKIELFQLKLKKPYFCAPHLFYGCMNVALFRVKTEKAVFLCIRFILRVNEN